AAATSIAVALRGSGQPRADTVPQIDLTEEQKRPPNPLIEEDPLPTGNALHRAIIALGIRLKTVADLEAPRVLSRWARFIEALRSAWGWLASWFVRTPEEYEVLRVWVPTFLKVQRERAKQELAKTILNPAEGEGARRSAACALTSITGRDF